jgi:phosphatidylserine/phosphatidylglycerophosphate/cardiolipin synthase-like enzyme
MTKRKSTSRKSASSRSSSKRSGSKRQSAAQAKETRILLYVVVIAIFLAVAIYLWRTDGDVEGLLHEIEQVVELIIETPEPNRPTVPGSGGDWWQVYFTDPNTVNNPEILTGSIEEKLIERINAAQRSIHIAAFEFNLTPVAQALITAHQRGVEVQWLTDDEYGLEADEEEDDHGQFKMLEDAGIEVRADDRTALMHNKFWIFDDQTVWTGSTNITVNGMFRNNNNTIIIESPELAVIYEREFAELWSGSFGPKSAATVDQQLLTIDDTPIEVYFAAEDEVVDYLLPHLQGAQQAIRYMAFSFTQDDLAGALLDRAKAGVSIEGIFETRGSETEYSELSALACAGLPVRQDGNPRTFHHKVFIIDGDTVVTGSFNFSDGANDSNDENVIIIKNIDIAQLYLAEFDRRWAEATPADLADLNCN